MEEKHSNKVQKLGGRKKESKWKMDSDGKSIEIIIIFFPLLFGKQSRLTGVEKMICMQIMARSAIDSIIFNSKQTSQELNGSKFGF